LEVDICHLLRVRINRRENAGKDLIWQFRTMHFDPEASGTEAAQCQRSQVLR
jgi:hypothetical protein